LSWVYPGTEKGGVMNRFSWLACVFLVLPVLAVGCEGMSDLEVTGETATAEAEMQPNETARDFSGVLIHNGIRRTYLVHVGSACNAGTPAPLVIVLHGGGGTGAGMVKLTGFNTVADRERFIVVYPDGVDRHWNDGRGVEWYRAHTQDIDDVGFISALIDELSGKLNIDSKRVYATGISNGGMMSYRLGCELSQRIAAIAAVTASIAVNKAKEWSPSRPMPVMIIAGTADPLVPWDGGDIRFGGRIYGTVLSMPDTVKFWVEKNGCSTRPVVRRLPDSDPTDGTTVRREVYSGCKGGAEVVLYAVEGGGHTWAGGLQYLQERIIGKTSREFGASEVIWQFFKQHSLD